MKSENRVTAVSFFMREWGNRIARAQFFFIIQERGCIMMKLFF